MSLENTHEHYCLADKSTKIQTPGINVNEHCLAVSARLPVTRRALPGNAKEETLVH